MQNNSIILDKPYSNSILWFITLTYTVVILLANLFDPRLIKFFGLTTDAGTLIFPFTFLLSDLITEVYGYKHARRAIWCGCMFNFLFIAYGLLVTHMPSPEETANNEMFDTIFKMDARIIIASIFSYFASEPVNSLVTAKLKIKMQGTYMGIRFLLSKIIASGIDSLIFGSIAFYSIMSNNNLISLILNMWLIKVMIELLGLPISVRLAKKLKQRERLDIYDTATNFKLFSLEANYTAKDNAFLK